MIIMIGIIIMIIMIKTYNNNNNNNNNDSNNNDNSKDIKGGTGRCDVKLRSNVPSTVCHAEDFPRRNIIFRNRTLRNILNIWVIT